MPAMFIEREHPAQISEAEWRTAVEKARARFAAGSLDVELRDRDGTWQRVLTWQRSCAEFSMLSYCAPYIEQLEALARALGATIIDNDGARYF